MSLFLVLLLNFQFISILAVRRYFPFPFSFVVPSRIRISDYVRLTGGVKTTIMDGAPILFYMWTAASNVFRFYVRALLLREQKSSECTSKTTKPGPSYFPE